MRELNVSPQARKVLRHLEKYRSITPLEALGVYGIFRLAARVYELRREGFNVVTTMFRDENEKPYAKYVLARAVN